MRALTSESSSCLDAGARDRASPSRVTGILLAGGVAVFLLSHVLPWFPVFVETVYVRGWSLHVVPPLSRLFGMLPFAAVEIVLAAYLMLRARNLILGAGALVRREAGPAEAARSSFRVLVRDASIALIFFYVLWGFHYARTPAVERLGLPPLDAVETAELERLARETIDLSNEGYRALHGTTDAGAPTAMPERWTALHAALEDGWRRSAEILSLDPLATAGFAHPKPLVLSPLFARLGITGIYSPFTAEALIVANTPAVSLGLTLAHEQAHQRGVTDEGEATFFGFVAAMESGDPLLRYAAATAAQNRLLALLRTRDPDAAAALSALRHPGVTRDLDDLLDFRRRHQGHASRAATRVNDTYLRVNRVPGGVESYDQVTEILIRYARHRGGSFEAVRRVDEPGETST